MTHEPECPESHNLVNTNVDCPCDELRSAYQRGREDAAKAIENMQSYHNWWVIKSEAIDAASDNACVCACNPSEEVCCARCSKYHFAVIRGDGPEERAFKELIRHSQEIGLYGDGEQE